MTVLPSTKLMCQYDEISERCKRTGKPVFLTANGKVDLVVLSIEAFEKREALLNLKERLLDIEADQNSGAKYYGIDELDDSLRKIVNAD